MAGLDSAPPSRCEDGILTTASASSLNARVNVASVPLKRKRDDRSAIGSIWQPFTVKAHPSVVFDKPRTLTPLFVLPRVHLSLAYLDTESLSGPLPRTRFVAAHVECLESSNLEHVNNDTKSGSPQSSGPLVLIARLDADRSSYAVERVKRGRYALCKLGNWVKLEELRAQSVLAIQDRADDSRKGPQSEIGVDRSRAASEMQSTVKASTGIKRPKLNGSDAIGRATVLSKTKTTEHDSGNAPADPTIEAMLGSRQVAPECAKGQVAADTGPNPIPISPSTATAKVQKALLAEQATEMIASPSTQSDPRDTFRMVQTQYLETLYLSKASLAYFAKGPLSRARAAFQSEGLPTGVPELLAFLQSCVLSPNVMDRKYRDSLSELVRSLLPGDMSEDEPAATATSDQNRSPMRKKKRRSNKLGPGKDGMFSQEDEYVARWWRSDEHDAVMTAARDAEGNFKKRMAGLRLRETKLQTILILEVLALQSSAYTTSPQAGDEKENIHNNGDALGKRPKSTGRKKALDLGLTLELLLDRLCIWQSVNLDGSGASMLRPGSREGGPRDEAGGTAASRPSTKPLDSDDLRDFCTDVIMPFYGARLPENCAAISRKLGGPSVPSPARPSPSERARTSKSSRLPGAPTKRTAPEKPQRRLERVLTDERLAQTASRRASLPPLLTRSATAPAAPRLKREASETPLSAIPGKDSQVPVSRGGILDPKRFSQREVDLGHAANRAEAKKRSQAAAADELKGAIQALKKPNRHLAGKDYMEDRERRMLAPGPNVKGRKPAGLTAFRAVQVEATPKGRHQRTVDAMATPVSGRRTQERPPGMPQSSNDLCIPSSTVKPGPVQFLERLHETPTKKHNEISSGIQETPCRGPSKLAPPLFSRSLPVGYQYSGQDIALPSSPCAPRTTSPPPAAGSSRPGFGLNVSSRDGTAEVQQGSMSGGIRGSISAQIQSGSPSVAERLGRSGGLLMAKENAGNEPSLYAQLGWDEDDELA